MNSVNKNKLNLPPNLKRKLILSKILFYLFIVFSFIAILNPKWGEQFVVSQFTRGLDIVYAIDVSRSMEVRDVPLGNNQNSPRQSRLERGLYIARQTVHTVQGSRIACVIGRSRGYLSVPLTYDKEAAINFLNNLDTNAMTGRSTNLQSLIETASISFLESSPAKKVIILISDGESHFGDIRGAVNQCIRDGIIILAIAVGSDQGMEVPGMQEDTPPISRRDAQVMRMIAERTGGVYIDGNNVNVNDTVSTLRTSLLSLSQEIKLSEDNKPSERQTEPKSRRGLFIIFAIISYALHKFVLKERRKTHRTSLITLYSLVFMICSFSSCSEGKLRLLEANYLFSRGRYEEAVLSFQKALEYEDASAYAEYGLGITFHSNDENMIALNHYENSMIKIKDLASDSEHRELRYRLQYNSGIIFFEEGDFDSAAVAFREALKTDSSKLEAKRNLEISLLSIAKETQTEREPEEGFEETRDMVFEMIRRNEEQHWQSGEWTEEGFTGPDY